MGRILITGTAGFIGFHLVRKMAGMGYQITGLDNINDYYDPGLKYARLSETGIDREEAGDGRMVASTSIEGYRFYRADLGDKQAIDDIFEAEKPSMVINLAAQAGVRYSIENPQAYITSNIVGFSNILEACRHNNIEHLVYASSSSVYGLNEKMPFSTSDNVDHPISLYAASKKSNELMAHTYSHLFGLPTTGLRFFTVYGPWGRPDMALFIFTKSIIEGKPIQLNNNGEMQRDFTYVDDIVNAIARVTELPPVPDPAWSGLEPDPASSPAPFSIYNIGNSNPVNLMDFVTAIENELGIKAIKEYRPMQPGDVTSTWADVSPLIRETGYRPTTSIEKGVKEFVKWYRNYKSL